MQTSWLQVLSSLSPACLSEAKPEDRPRSGDGESPDRLVGDMRLSLENKDGNSELGSKVLKIQLQPSSPSPEAPQPDQPPAGPPGLTHPHPSVPAPRIALFHSSPGWSDLATLQCSAESHRDSPSSPSTMLPELSSLSMLNTLRHLPGLHLKSFIFCKEPALDQTVSRVFSGYSEMIRTSVHKNRVYLSQSYLLLARAGPPANLCVCGTLVKKQNSSKFEDLIGFIR